MRKGKFKIRITAALCAVLGWWGLLYPDLTLPPDTVRIICREDGTEYASDRDWSFDDNLYLELLGTDRDNIRFRSRLLTELNAFWEALSWDKSTAN